MSIEALRDVVAQLSASASALAVLGAELQARISGTSIHPTLRAQADDLLREAGALSALDGVSAAEVAPLLAELRHFWSLDHDFLATPERAPGWTYTDTDVLQCGGEITEGFANVLPRFLPHLEGLAARLEGSDGAFLDVGTGVARLAIGMARKWPSLRVVGLDVWGPSLALARQNVAAAGLDGRIQIREEPGEALADEGAFDLAWIPAPFIPPHALGRLVEQVRRSLKPGGWLLFAAAKPGEDLRGAALRFRVALYGGAPSTQPEIEKLLVDKGITEVRTLPGPPRDFKIIVAGRRA
ncbi:MAG TPA: class I SAM-dependent methyltransferase [Polyangiaceae bacterium]|jgi:SAM-dependent methyltransferase|nr:class I SAM-dependent methyltransferase [Polyangiaceae bacterium]